MRAPSVRLFRVNECYGDFSPTEGTSHPHTFPKPLNVSYSTVTGAHFLLINARRDPLE